MPNTPTASDRERHDAIALAARANVSAAEDPALAAFLAAIERDGLLHECRRAWPADWSEAPDLGALVASARRPGAATHVFWRSDGALHICRSASLGDGPRRGPHRPRRSRADRDRPA